VSQVIITKKDEIFYRALTIVAAKTPKVFDSRSSDTVTLAIRFKAPIRGGLPEQSAEKV